MPTTAKPLTKALHTVRVVERVALFALKQHMQNVIRGSSDESGVMTYSNMEYTK